MPTPSVRSPQDGFTLLEILVALAIIGFLLAMISPRLGGTGQKAAQTLTHANMGRLLALITYSLQKDGRYPTGLINIVSVDGSNTYHKPMVSDGNPDTGFEILNDKLDSRHRLFIHYLSAAEAAELRELGVMHVYNFNSPHDRSIPTHASPMQKAPTGVGVPVLMTAGGAASGAAPITAETAAEADRAHPDDMFRILLGLGAESSLVTSGQIQGAATSPESTQAPVNHEWRWYGLLLPRLKATEKRLRADNPLGMATNGTVTAYAVNGAHDAAALTKVTSRTVDAYKAQHPAFFAVLDSEGVVDPTVDMTGWGVDFNADGDIN